MAERVFNTADLLQIVPSDTSCGCLQCRLASLFARHLDHVRSPEVPAPSRVLGHWLRPLQSGNDTAVPHLVQMDIGAVVDTIVWEIMGRAQLAAWLPSGSDAGDLDRIVEALPAIVALRASHRSGAIRLADGIEAAIEQGRYLSVRFVLEQWKYFGSELGRQHAAG